MFKCYVNLFIIDSNIHALNLHLSRYSPQNQQILQDLFELYLLYGIVDTFSAQFLKVK
jgi:hypothetical protein